MSVVDSQKTLDGRRKLAAGQSQGLSALTRAEFKNNQAITGRES